MSDLVVVVPLWRRIANLERLLTSFRATTPDERMLFVVSANDTFVQAALTGLHLHDAMLLLPGDGGGGGDYARKINAGYRASDEQWVFTGADDLVFTPGWWEAAKRAAHRPPWDSDQPRIGVVGTNDDCNDRVKAGEHSTHSLVARWYADQGAVVNQPGTIYFEGYDHDHCDDELVQTAKMRGVFVHARDSVVRHYHPMAGRAEDDETYQRGRARTRLSHSLYRRRSRLWRTP